MAKKLVKYAFGNHGKYASLKKRDQYTVYFVYDTVEDPITHKQVPGEYGTIYKGNTRIGTARACDLVFDTELKVCLLEGPTPEESEYYTIEAGTSLADFASNVLKTAKTWDEEMYARLIGYDGDEEHEGDLGIIRSIISSESLFDEATGDAMGIISDTINTRLAQSIGDGPGNNVKAFMDDNYVSKSELGKVQELAEIFQEDPEALDTLVAAAGNISEALSNYYTKEEATALLDNIVICDTYDDFPPTGIEGKIYIDAEENLMYRWGKKDPEVEASPFDYLSVGGSNSGGNTSVETKMFIKDGKTTVSIAKDTDYDLYYIFSSANTFTTYNKRTDEFTKVQQQTGSAATVVYSIDGVRFDSGTCAQSNFDENDESKNVYNHYRIPASRFIGTQHKIKIEATSLSSNETASQEVTINVVNVTINSTYSAPPASLANPISIPVTVSSTNSVDVFYKVDDEEPVLGTTIATGAGTMNISISNNDAEGNSRTPGAHNISVWAVTTVGGNTLTTSSLDYTVLWYDPVSTTPIVSFVCLDEIDPVEQKYTATQYEYSKFRYQVYPGRGNDTANIQLIAACFNPETGKYEDNIINSLEVDKNVRNWSYIFDNEGEYEIYVKVLYTAGVEDRYIDSDKVNISVKKSAFAMDPVPGAKLYMTAKDHDNKGEHTWVDTIDPSIKAILNNFVWTDNSGWYNDAPNATTSLRVANGAVCTIPFKPFSANYAESGMTLEFDFSTSNLSNSEAEIIKCYSPEHGTGVVITATGAYWETGTYKKSDINDTRIYVPFKEGERVRVSFVMTPRQSDDVGSATHNAQIWDITNKKYDTIETVSQGWWKFFKVYINGICVSVNSYTGDGGISQGTQSPSNIVIGSTEATVDLYNIRFYDKTLYDKDIVANYIADTQNPVEKVKIFKRNNILNLEGNAIDYSKLISKIPCLFITCVSSSTYAGFTNDQHILPMSKADKRGFNVVFNCEQLDDEAKANYPWAKSFVAYNAQMQVQGTSSQYYPRKNYKLKFKTPKNSSVAYEETIATKKPTFLFVGTTGNAYDSTMNVNSFIKSNCENQDNLDNFWQKKYQLRKYPAELEGLSVEHINSVAATAFCLKADFMESSSTHNTGMAKFVDFLSKNMSENYSPLTPPQKAQYNASTRSGTDKMIDVTIRTCIDGYPIAVFWRKTYDDNYTFLGKYNFNIDKGAENVFGFIDNIENLINPYTGYNFQSFDEDYYDKASTADRQAYVSPVECWEFTNNSTGLCKFTGLTEDSFRCDSKLNPSVAEWTESFEARHPDNDLLAADFASKVKVPTNFEALCQWISSTDRTGKLLGSGKKVATTWKGSYEELVAGGEAGVSTLDLNETMETLGKDPGAKAEEYWNKGKICILAPYTVEQLGDGMFEITPSTEYNFYGYIVIYNETENKWELGEKFEAPVTDVDKSVYYYIAKEGDPYFGKVVNYDESSNTWIEYASIEEYRLPAPKVYGNITYTYDTAEYRLDKFKYELEDHMNLNATTFYYIMTEFFAQVDQRAKNLMFATWGYEPGISNVKPANAFPTVEAAKAAGYKPVYSYSLSKAAAAATPMIYGAGEGKIYINEVDTAAKKIELYNSGNTDVDISGWDLHKFSDDGDSDSSTSPGIAYLLPEGTIIPANGYYVTGAAKTTEGPSYGISGKKEWLLTLYNLDKVEIDSITNNANGVFVGPTLAEDGSTLIASKEPVLGANIARETDGSDVIIAVETTTLGVPNDFTATPGSVRTSLPIYQTYTCEVPEFSGICKKTDDINDGFYAVSDGGKLYSVSITGDATEIPLTNVSSTVRFIGKVDDATYTYIPYSGDAETRSDFDTTIVPNTDFEAITRAEDGKIYVMADYRAKSAKSNYVVNLYIYELVENDGEYSLATVTTIDTTESFEGFTFKEGTTFLLGRKDKANVYTVDLSTVVEGTPTAITKITTEAFENITTEVADICYDGENIWTIDSIEKTLCKLTPAGEFVEKFEFVFAEENPESMLVDTATQELWIGCDNGNAASQVTNLIQVSLDGHLLGASPVVVNECDPDNKWLELYNTTPTDIDLQGYRIVKDNDETSAFTFQNSTILPGNDRIVLTVKNDGIAGPTFGMSATKGFDYKIYDNTGKLIEHFDNLTNVTKVPDGCTIGRKVDGGEDIVIFKYHGSIGKSNSNGVLNSGIYINAVDSSGNIIGKRFEIYNSTSADYNLTGHSFVKDGTTWAVVDTAVGEGTYTTTESIPAAEEGQEPTTEPVVHDCSLGLPSLIVPTGGRIVVQCNNAKSKDVTAGKNAVVADATKWPSFGLSTTKGYVLEIKDADGTIIDKVDNFHNAVPNPNFIDAAYVGRVTDGAEEFVKFNADPLGVSNDLVESELRATPVRDENSNIYINEIYPADDLVELYNASDEEISLGTYMLSKNFDSLDRWTFPVDATIAAHGFYTVNLKQYDTTIGPRFGVSTSDFIIVLSDATDAIVDVIDNRVAAPNAVTIPTGMSWGRVEDGGNAWDFYSVPSIGASNATGTIYVPEVLDFTPGNLITDHLVINEIQGATGFKRIEIYNPTNSAIDLGGNYALIKEDADGYVNNETGCDYWIYPTGARIEAKGHYVSAAGQDASSLGATFGISLRQGKNFKLRLMKVTNSTDYTTLDSILATAQLVDICDNTVKAAYVADKDSKETFGRINDGSENWALFEAPGTIGLSNNTGNPIALPKSEEENAEHSVATVLYYVPESCNYIYYPIFYDNDTMLSVNNTGYMIYKPNIESTDKVGSGYAYNGTESTLWLNFKDAFAGHIRNIYDIMRKDAGLNYANITHFFNDTQSDMWAENVYNMDAKFKYVDPATIGYTDFSIAAEALDASGNTVSVQGANVRDPYYLYECQGSRKTHRSWWLNNRFTYMDSRYYIDHGSTDYAQNYAVFRLYTPTEGAYNPAYPADSTFHIIPYTDMYLRIKFGAKDVGVRAEKNKVYDVSTGDPTDRFNDTETMVYGAPYILSYGDLTGKYVKQANTGPSSRITELKFGTDAPYYNDNLVNLAFNTANTSLKYIDVRNCRNLSTLANLNALASLTSLKATNTSVSAFDFNETGVALTEVAFPKTLTALVLKNMPYLKRDGMTFESFSGINKVVIENCPELSATSFRLIRDIIAASPKMTNLRISGINWNITTPDEFNDWKKIIKLNAVSEQGIDNAVLGIPYISGTVNLNDRVISTGYKEGLTRDMLEKTGANIKIIGGNETSLNDININGPLVITPNVEYTYSIEYGPDNYVVDEQKGVTWEVSNGLEIIEQERDYIVVKFAGSATGKETFNIKATSIASAAIPTKVINIRPTATLSSIHIFDMTGNEISYSPSEPTLVYENSSVSFEVRFNPSDTIDTEIEIDVTNPDAFVKDGSKPYSYSSNDHIITFTGAEVTQKQTAIVRVTSKNLPTLGTTFTLIVNNVVSRIITLQDDTLGRRVKGYIDVKVDNVNTSTIFSVFSDDNGVITLPTNIDNIDKYAELYNQDKSVVPGFGFRGITVTAHAIDENLEECLYNAPDPVYFPALPETADSDVEQTISFYSPITCNITVMNNGNVVDDAYLKIKSIENASIRYAVMGGETSTQYNNVMILPYDGTGTVTNPASIKLLANTNHNIEIVETDSIGVTLTSGAKYSKYTGIIKTGTNTGGVSAEMNVVINISRDYLGDIQRVKNTELHMVVVTGTEDAGDKTLRLYYRTVGNIVIDWGDGMSDTINTPETTDNAEHVIFHTYSAYETEYDIVVKSDETSNTEYIRWFHVISESATFMTPCFGAGNTNAQFSSTWGNKTTGGLVAYQSCGTAKFDTMPSFRFDTNRKQYSKLLCVGEIYNSCVDITSADYLFANSTLEQIPSSPMFAKCKKITSFNFTFYNTNITEFPASFFTSNNRAASFTSTFESCSHLGAIRTDINSPFFMPDDDVEITSVKNMFKGCSSIVSEVPEFWKMFYGCSFSNSYQDNANAQMTFSGCSNASNYTSVPSDWGGFPTTSKYEYSANPIKLRYIKLGADEQGYFEFPSIYLKPNYRYILDIGYNPSNGAYGIVPLFGCAHSEEPGNLSKIDRVIDFSYNGSTTGINPGSHTSYFLYRLGKNKEYAASNTSLWYAATIGTSGGESPAPVMECKEDYNRTYQRIKLNICQTADGKLYYDKYDVASPRYIANMSEWSSTLGEWTETIDENVTTITANVPLRIFSSYQVKVEYLNGTKDANSYYPEKQAQISFYGLQVYNNANELVHNIVPKFAFVGNTPTAILTDTVNDTVAAGQGVSASKMTYYKQNINDDNATVD